MSANFAKSTMPPGNDEGNKNASCLKVWRKGEKIRHAETTKNTVLHAQSLTRPLKRYVPNRKVVFWATRGYDKLRGEGVCVYVYV